MAVERDPTRQDVPAAQSIKTAIDTQWRLIQQHIYNDLPFAFEIEQAEEWIALRAGEILSGRLGPQYDWQYDLDLANFAHRFNKHWVDHHRSVRADLRSYWLNWSGRTGSWLRDFAQSSLKSLLFFHGAVALGALNALVQHPNDQFTLAAKLGLLFPIIGIVTLAVGQIALFQFLAGTTNAIEGYAFGKAKWRRLIALGRYRTRRLRRLKMVDYLIFGSTIWFCTYLIILFFVLVS